MCAVATTRRHPTWFICPVNTHDSCTFPTLGVFSTAGATGMPPGVPGLRESWWGAPGLGTPARPWMGGRPSSSPTGTPSLRRPQPGVPNGSARGCCSGSLQPGGESPPHRRRAQVSGVSASHPVSGGPGRGPGGLRPLAAPQLAHSAVLNSEACREPTSQTPWTHFFRKPACPTLRVAL